MEELQLKLNHNKVLFKTKLEHQFQSTLNKTNVRQLLLNQVTESRSSSKIKSRSLIFVTSLQSLLVVGLD